jgi:hypothetical protein
MELGQVIWRRFYPLDAFDSPLENLNQWFCNIPLFFFLLFFPFYLFIIIIYLFSLSLMIHFSHFVIIFLINMISRNAPQFESPSPPTLIRRPKIRHSRKGTPSAQHPAHNIYIYSNQTQW